MIPGTMCPQSMAYPVRYIRKDRDRTMRLLALVLGKSFINDFWTTYRLPFQRHVTITYPPAVTHPEARTDIVAHEMFHVRQFERPLAPVVMLLLAALVPLPTLFSGRWFIERRAYLHDIRTSRLTLERAVDILWSHYGYAWPKPLMRRWFKRQLASSRSPLAR